MKNLFYYSFALLLVTGVASCSSDSKTSADSDSTVLTTKPAEQAPVNTDVQSPVKPNADTTAKDTTVKL